MKEKSEKWREKKVVQVLTVKTISFDVMSIG